METRIQIRMTKTMPGSDDGITVKTYEQGQSYEMGDDLGGVFIREGWGHEEDPDADDPEVKNAGAAPANKNAGPAPYNKAVDQEGDVQPWRRLFRRTKKPRRTKKS